MPGQRGSENRRRNHIYTLRLDDAEVARLEEVAAFSGIAKADVVRRLLKHDHSRIVPSRNLTQEILRLGQNVNQIARALNSIKVADDQSAGWIGTLAALDRHRLALRSSVDEMVRIRRQMENWR